MNYKVYDTEHGKVFDTLDEARGYANEIAEKSGYIVAVVETTAKVTHIYRKEKVYAPVA